MIFTFTFQKGAWRQDILQVDKDVAESNFRERQEMLDFHFHFLVGGKIFCKWTKTVEEAKFSERQENF